MTATAPTSTGEQAGELQTLPYVRKPALPALTGLRTLLALTILLFHFTPGGLQRGPFSLYPIINIGYVFVSFFFLISGFILSYNYADRPEPVDPVDFLVARWSRLYPVYALTMLVSLPMLVTEWHVRSHTEFWTGTIATPLLLQGFFPHLATFWMTVTWTLSCEVMLYLAFPWLLRLRWPAGTGKLAALLLALWIAGMIPHSVYILHDPDHVGHMADRYTDGLWINTLKYTPFPYVCTFLAGLTLGRLHEALKLSAQASVFSWRPLVAVGASTYCLYLLHFNVFVLLHVNRVPERLHVQRFDPWISYVFIVLLAMAAQRWVEHPCQVAIGGWWRRRRVAQT
jgi:peptidoglycan/LPS O-acetylase OafA/YrhL